MADGNQGGNFSKESSKMARIKIKRKWWGSTEGGEHCEYGSGFHYYPFGVNRRRGCSPEKKKQSL